MKTTIQLLGQSYPIEGNEDLISRANSITTTEILDPSELFGGADFYEGSGALTIFNKNTQTFIYSQDFTCENELNARIKYFADLGIIILKEKSNDRQQI